ncbi:MAG: Gfo/Idh/MocA family oxidoreductase [Candidatus Cloacimonetes bacterium]|nr:Gfo/Idh/MocA family oxidoreductase [Candidatus Cloacimonadota bacterium]
MANKIRFGIIGAGSIARFSHIPAIDKLQGAELVAICRRNKEKADELGKTIGVKEIYYDYEDLLKSKNIDAVIIASPNVFHKDHATAAAEAGKHVLCEKPIAINLKDAREIIEVCKKNKVKLQVGFNQRYWNQVKIAKDLLDEGCIGDVKSFYTTYREKWDLYQADTNFRDDINQSGGACLIDMGIHRIDMIRFFMGEISDVFAEINHSVMPTRLDDNNWLLLKSNKGAIGSLSCDKYTPPVVNETALYGTRGTMYLSTEIFNPFQPVPLAIYVEEFTREIPEIIENYVYPTKWEDFWKDKPAEKTWIPITPQKVDPYLAQIKDFCECIIEDRNPSVTGEDGIRSLEIVLAAYKSSKEKRWVSLPLEEEVVGYPL